MAYTTLEDVRALPKLSDDTAYIDAGITEGIAWAKVLIDDYCGTTFEPTAFTKTLDGNGSASIFVGVPDLLTVTSCTVDGVAVSDVSGWVVKPGGVVTRDTGLFIVSVTGQNVVIAGTAGLAAVPADIAWAAKTLARWYVLRLNSEAPDNAIQVSTAGGDFRLNAQPGKYGPTALPEVNAVLMRRKTRHPSIA